MARQRVKAKGNVGAGTEDFYMDQIDTDLVPVTKILLGDDDVDGGFIHAGNPMPVRGTRSNAGTDLASGASHVTIGGSDGTNLRPVLVDAAGRQSVNVNGSVAVTGAFWQATQPVSLASQPLPTGASTETTLAALNAKVPASPAQDRTTAAAPSAVRLSDGTAFISTMPVSGPLTDAQLRATAVPVSGTFWQATQPVSLASQPLPTGASTETTLAAINTKIPSSPAQDRITAAAPSAVRLSDGTSFISTMPVSGPLTDAQLRATAVPVSGPLTDTQLRATAVPVSGPLTDAQLRATAVPISDAATGAQADAAASTDTGTFSMIALIKRMLTKMPAQGQAVMAASQPVAIASDQSAVPVNQAGVSATGSLAVLNATVALSLNGATGFAIDVRGTFVGTVTFEGTVDGTNWFTVTTVAAGGGAAAGSVTAPTAPGAWWGNATGLQQVRGRCSAYTSGTITVVIRAMQAAGVVTAFVSGATTVPVSGTVTANIGTGSIAAGANAIGDVGVQYRANATGAGTPTNINSPATPVGQTIKGSAGRLLGFVITNNEASTRWLKIFNATSVTPGTTAALTELALPVNAPIVVKFEGGIAFGTGIMIMVTGGQGLTNNTAITGNGVTGFTVHA